MGQLVKRVSMMPRDDAIDTVNNTLSVLNDISDDIVCLAKIGVLEKETGKRFEPRSNWLWLSCITMDLYACGRDLRTLEAKCRALEYDIIATATSAAAADGTLARKKRQELTAVTEKRRMQVVSLLKLMADLGFCAYDCAEATFSDQFQAACGFTAGALALYKLWRKAL